MAGILGARTKLPVGQSVGRALYVLNKSKCFVESLLMSVFRRSKSLTLSGVSMLNPGTRVENATINNSQFCAVTWDSFVIPMRCITIGIPSGDVCAVNDDEAENAILGSLSWLSSALCSAIIRRRDNAKRNNPTASAKRLVGKGGKPKKDTTSKTPVMSAVTV